MDRYKIIKTLGEGTFAIVYKATNIKSGEVVAIKKMKKKYSQWEDCIQLREIKSLRKLNHISIIKLKEVIKVKDELFLVFEYLEQDVFNLYVKFKEKGQQIPEPQIKSLMYQMCSGLAYMHKHGFFHRDLKPENLLVHGNTVKICDFGLAREIRSRPPFTDYVSTRWYRAPEILLRSTTYNSPVDIFALGCIFAELYLLNPLFPGTSEVDQLYKICQILGTPSQKTWNEGYRLAALTGFKFPNFQPKNLQELIPTADATAIQLLSEMFQYDPQKRPTAQQILNHAYFEGIQQNPYIIASQSQNQSKEDNNVQGTAEKRFQKRKSSKIQDLLDSTQKLNNQMRRNSRLQQLLQDEKYKSKNDTFQSISSIQISRRQSKLTKENFLNQQQNTQKHNTQENSYDKQDPLLPSIQSKNLDQNQNKQKLQKSNFNSIFDHTIKDKLFEKLAQKRGGDNNVNQTSQQLQQQPQQPHNFQVFQANKLNKKQQLPQNLQGIAGIQAENHNENDKSLSSDSSGIIELDIKTVQLNNKERSQKFVEQLKHKNQSSNIPNQSSQQQIIDEFKKSKESFLNLQQQKNSISGSFGVGSGVHAKPPPASLSLNQNQLQKFKQQASMMEMDPPAQSAKMPNLNSKLDFKNYQKYSSFNDVIDILNKNPLQSNKQQIFAQQIQQSSKEQIIQKGAEGGGQHLFKSNIENNPALVDHFSGMTNRNAQLLRKYQHNMQQMNQGPGSNNYGSQFVMGAQRNIAQSYDRFDKINTNN